VPLTCYLFDADDRFCPNSSAPISFTLEGPGSFDISEIIAESGVAMINYFPSQETGVAKIIATSSGLVADTVSIRIRDKIILDDFESYNSDSELQNDWLNTSGYADLSLDSEHGIGQCLKLAYGIGGDYPYTSVVEKSVNHSFAGGNYFTFWMLGNTSNHDIEIRLYDVDRNYWRYTVALNSESPGVVSIPLTEFSNVRNLDLSLANLAKVRFTIRKGEGDDGTGTLYWDDFKFPESAPSDVKKSQNDMVPHQFELEQNYPNPFNLSTTISYSLPIKAKVLLAVYNVQGQLVDTIVDKIQEAGRHTMTWNAPHFLSSGVYFFKMKTDNFAAIKKCLLAK